MKEKAITDNWIDPDDAPALTPDWFEEAELRNGTTIVRRGRPRSDNPKETISLRLDRDLIARLRESGPGWQTRINDTLRKAAGL